MPKAPALSLSFTAQVGKKYVAFVKRHLRRAHEVLDPPLRELSVALVNDRTMSALHEQFMNFPGPTDVLTFPLAFAPRSRTNALSGEVVICVPEASRRARS